MVTGVTGVSTVYAVPVVDQELKKDTEIVQTHHHNLMELIVKAMML